MTLEKLLSHRPILVVLGGCLLCLPALLNGRVFIFLDSEIYYSLGKGMFEALLGTLTPESAGQVLAQQASEALPAQSALAPQSDGGLLIAAGGRSPLYSAFVFTGSLISIGLVAFVQAILVSWFVLRLIDWLKPGLSARYILLVYFGLALATSLGYHASVIMPDVFTGLLVIAIGFLLFKRDLKWPEIVFLSLAIIGCALMHTTILLLGLFLLVLVFCYRWLPGALSMAPLHRQGFIFAALAAAMVANEAYVSVVSRVTSTPVMSPPYLMARTIADGPGQDYLNLACVDPVAEHAFCTFAGIPYADHNDFLWGVAGASHNYMTVPRDVKVAVKNEQSGFVLNVLKQYPVEQISISALNGIQQIFAFGLHELHYGARYMQTINAYGGANIFDVVSKVPECSAAPGGCRGTPVLASIWSGFTVLIGFISLAGFIALLAWSIRARVSGEGAVLNDEALLFFCLLVAALLINAGMCGAGSGVHDRYQSRLFWLVPLCAALFATELKPFALLKRFQRSATPAQ